MAVPKFFEFFEVFLNALSDGQTHKAKDVREYIADVMHISAEDRSVYYPANDNLHLIIVLLGREPILSGLD